MELHKENMLGNMQSVGGAFAPGFMMLLMPGTPGPNKYGPPPPPNSRAVNVLAAITIFLIGLGICAMVAVLALGLMTAVINAVNSNSL